MVGTDRASGMLRSKIRSVTEFREYRLEGKARGVACQRRDSLEFIEMQKHADSATC